MQNRLAKVKKEVAELARKSKIGRRFRDVFVDVGDLDEGEQFLRVQLVLDRTDDLSPDDVRPLVTAIRRRIGKIDDRFPSVRFMDAA